MPAKNLELYVVLIAIAAVPLAGSFMHMLQVSATIGQTFTTQMSGNEEVPPVDTTASGTAEFSFTSDRIDYKLNVVDISGVRSAHIHSGNVGENGPIVVTLLDSDTPINPTNGILSEGTISAADLEGPMEGEGISDLISSMSSGVTYVNVHTETNPEGEIRGQL